MKAIELVNVDAVTYQVREISVLGVVSYTPQYTLPWYAEHGELSHRFKTKAEAVQFASTGKA